MNNLFVKNVIKAVKHAAFSHITAHHAAIVSILYKTDVLSIV